jgi:hypothetical protein
VLIDDEFETGGLLAGSRKVQEFRYRAEDEAVAAAGDIYDESVAIAPIAQRGGSALLTTACKLRFRRRNGMSI